MQTIPNKLDTGDGVVRKKFNWLVRNYYEAQQIIRDAGTFAMMFTNIGDSITYVNGLVLYPGTPGSVLGDSRQVSTPQADMEFAGIINVGFSGGSGTGNNLEVTVLFYVD